jgi:RES domain-containing protein
MILCSLGPDAPFYRALTPSRAYQPESGAGAALVGGRFNRPHVEARYLAATPEAALAEYQGESPLLPPATLATYQVTAEAVVDFTGGYNAEHWSPIWLPGDIRATLIGSARGSDCHSLHKAARLRL